MVGKKDKHLVYQLDIWRLEAMVHNNLNLF
jgi:hypothetical protein